MDSHQNRKARGKSSLVALLVLTVTYASNFACSTAFVSKPERSQRSWHVGKSLATVLPACGDTVDSTIVELMTPNNHQIVLVGTAHMSKPSQDQVEAVIQRVQLNVVLVELDPSRSSRIGIDGMDDIQVSRVVTAAEDVLVEEISNGDGEFNLFRWWQRTILDGFSRLARVWLTYMYDEMND
jgi:uncharacterized protein YaiI (UPF0178 family)